MLPIKYNDVKIKILDFDIENRPSTYLGMDFTTSEITAIGWRFTHEAQSKTQVRLLTKENTSADVVEDFMLAYEQADMVTGHFIRNHDLPIVNATLVEWGLHPLCEKYSSCTKNDLIGFKGISKSQESLCAMFGIPEPKIQMNQMMWRESNRLTELGLTYTKARVVGDVHQHIALRKALIQRGLLQPPRPWSPNPKSGPIGYTP